ncbi:PREDICTED: uncharacterized protein LOC109116617 [Tarenaya hassleriana]|uniref:uncharacterized protein LOC109116617 n=1 Tax=Tarenaya hassleriana TaxID=28532 RepID=UPI0008FD36EB|nr:PREDICTED: uncharacterized protein LOC109116617 [Tarenaya hassleriana]
MVRQRRREKEEEEEERQEDGEEVKAVEPTRRISRRNMQSLVIGLIGAALTIGAYSQTVVSPTKCIGAGLFVLFFGLLVSEGFISP